jgi:hypothetical protein
MNAFGKLAGFAVVLGVVFGLALLTGRAVGPIGGPAGAHPEPAVQHGHQHTGAAR